MNRMTILPTGCQILNGIYRDQRGNNKNIKIGASGNFSDNAPWLNEVIRADPGFPDRGFIGKVWGLALLILFNFYLISDEHEIIWSQ